MEVEVNGSGDINILSRKRARVTLSGSSVSNEPTSALRSSLLVPNVTDDPSIKPPPLTSRKEEFGVVSVKSLVSVVLKFQNSPIWILGLYPIRIQQIYVPDFLSFSEIHKHIDNLKIDTQIFNKVVTSLGRRRFVFGSLPQESSVWLVSGNIDYLNDQINTLQKKRCIFITDHHK